MRICLGLAFVAAELLTAPARLGAAEYTQRQWMLSAMKARPADPWPRGLGHVIQALPGTREADKSYCEPGGSYSPRVGSFGISFWMVNNNGSIAATSDSIPLDQIQQEWAWRSDRELPAIQVTTTNYQAVWQLAGPGRWQLTLNTTPLPETKTVLVIRSVGPAGGPIQSLQWKSNRVLIDQRWAIACKPEPASVQLGHEGNPGWTTEKTGATNWLGNDGWGYVRLELPGTNTWAVTIDGPSAMPGPLPFFRTKSMVDVSLPEPRFAACMNAQTAQLMMGLVGNQTRRCDPMNSPVAWTGSGAYTVVALARAGHLPLAQQLVRSLAENDFQGGFGPEADAPALALWAMNEVALRVADPRFDSWLWPHVLRKSKWIMQMRVTLDPIYLPPTSAVVPQYARHRDLNLLCDPAANDLINGRVDWQRPLLYVNAVNYLGLTNSAEIAVRVRDYDAAAWFILNAGQIKQAWSSGFRTAVSPNDRAFTCGLWPAWVVTDVPSYLQAMDTRWNQSHTAQGERKANPTHSWYTAAEAHQWLDLGRPDRAEDTLRWLWEHDASPGLFTWTEGSGEVDTYHRWDQVRGWANPPYVSPQYQTAAEILLLQLDMLAGVELFQGNPVLVIGTGIVPEWLNQPMHARSVSTRIGLVDWSWQDGKMFVAIRGRRIPVRLGPAFPARTPLIVR